MKRKEITLSQQDQVRLIQLAKKVEEESQNFSDEELEAQVQNEVRFLLHQSKIIPFPKIGSMLGLLSVAALLFIGLFSSLQTIQEENVDYHGFKGATGISQNCQLKVWQKGEVHEFNSNGILHLTPDSPITFISKCSTEPLYVGLRIKNKEETNTYISDGKLLIGSQPLSFKGKLLQVPAENLVVDVLWSSKVIDHLKVPQESFEIRVH